MPSKIRKRGENSYELTISAGFDETGKRRIFRKTVQADGITLAKQLYKQFANEVDAGKAIASGKPRMTLAEFYAYWKHHHADQHLAVTTRTIVKDVWTRIEAGLGHLKIDQIAPRHILQFIDQLNAPDASAKNLSLSQAYKRKHVSVLKTLFSYALQWEFIHTDPAEKIPLPKLGSRKKKTVDEEDLQSFFALLSAHKILKHRLWIMLAFSIGLRREEVFGLQWGDLNWDKQTVMISRAAVYTPETGIDLKDTKSDNSFRTLSLPADIIVMLKEWQEETKAAAKRRAKRNKVVDLVDPVSADKWIFPQADGTVGHPHAFNNFLKSFCTIHNLPSISPHRFRHLCGSYLLSSGVDIATISGKLGHADKSFTMKTYVHELQSAEQHSATVMQRILDKLKKPVQTKKGQAK